MEQKIFSLYEDSCRIEIETTSFGLSSSKILKYLVFFVVCHFLRNYILLVAFRHVVIVLHNDLKQFQYYSFIVIMQSD